jgi:hypothetical protein
MSRSSRLRGGGKGEAEASGAVVAVIMIKMREVQLPWHGNLPSPPGLVNLHLSIAGLRRGSQGWQSRVDAATTARVRWPIMRNGAVSEPIAGAGR